MTDIEQIKQDLEKIKERNKRVELDKAWETSWFRKVTIIVLTYLIIVLFMWIAEIPSPWMNAIVPSVGFWLSTVTLPVVKGWWVRSRKS